MEEKQKDYSTGERILMAFVLFFPVLFLNVLAFFLGVAILCLLGSVLVLAIAGVFQFITGVAMVGIGIEKIFAMPMGACAVAGFGFANIGVALLLECIVCQVYLVWVPKLLRRGRGKEVFNEKTP